MPENRKKLTLRDVKGFFSSLSVKERCGIAARSFLFLFCSVLISLRFKEFGVDDDEFCFSIIVLFGFSFLLSPSFFIILYLPFLALLFLDFHLFRTYGLSVSSFGPQIFAVLLDTNKAEVLEYMTRISLFEWMLLTTVFVALTSAFFYKRKATILPEKQRMLVLFVLCVLYPFTYTAHFYPLIRSVSASKNNESLAKSKMFRFNPAKDKTKADTVVVLIGESHRQSEFAPVFDRYADKFQTLYRFSDMISPFPGTLKAVPMILSRKKVTDEQNFFYERSLFSLFREAGYETYFLHYIEMYTESHLSFIYREAGRFIKYAGKITPTTDEGILPVLNDILTDKNQKKLIVIKMIGVHINFVSRYPDPETSAFRRLMMELKPKTKEREMFHYKKAIAYSAGIIEKIMETVEKRPEPSLLLFSSDHGICIFDKGFFHLPATCRNAFHIPAMILLNPALSAATSQQAKDNLSCNQDKPLTEEYDFETIASLAGISYPSADARYDLTKRCFYPDGKKRRIVVGEEKTFYEDL